ncbi:MAG: heparinase II/III family protein [Clostridia bacterium]|nr:heparinase II/III family protein [Clostridia bacterium]
MEGIKLFGKGADPAFWQGVREKECYGFLREDLEKCWELYGLNPIKALTYSDFRLFKYTGNRSVYENEYCYRRKSAVTSALLALIYPEEEKYPVRLMDSLYAVCDEYTWCLPAHNTALEVNNNVHIDIFAAETGIMMAEIYTLLGDRLEPLIRDRIRTELKRRIITPWENKTYGWEKNEANWNTVCTGGIAIVTMLVFPELFTGYLPRISRNIERYLGGFKEDGICEEGVSYWHYGFGNFVFFADMIRKFTDGGVDYFARPKVKEISMFFQKINLNGQCTVSFSDANPFHHYHIGLLHYLKREYPDAITVSGQENSYITDGRGRWNFYLRAVLWLEEEYLSPDPQAQRATFFAPYSQWLVHKEPGYGFAVKGGHNAEPHNHNDVGSFIIAKDGKHVFADLGAGPYTRQYFAPSTRYGIVQCSSRGHSVPIVNGEYQREGAEFAARNTRFEDGVFYTDIAGAYGIEALRSAIRSFKCTENAVILKDSFEYEGEGDIIERFAVRIPPESVGDGAVKVGGITLRFDPASCDLSFSSESLNEKSSVYFVDFKLKNGIREFTAFFDMG